MGFGEATSSTIAVKSVVGQMAVGSAQHFDFRIESGFLADTLLRGFIVAVKDEAKLPLTYSLEQNYPNPFNPLTVIRYSLPFQSRVSLKVYDVLGREVSVLVNEEKPAGIYDVQFNATNLPSGVYFYRIFAGDFTETKKLIILK